jgi:hypothetical protein
MVQAERHEEPVEGAVDKATQDRGAGDECGDRVQAGVEQRVEQRADDADDDRRARGDDRDEPAPAEEGEIGG